MQVHRSIEGFPKIQNAIVTQGTFDGVHVAHQVILQQLREIAHEKNGETVVIT
jgi:riboflavin kinase/FMN adenylyltransferase